MLAGRGVLVAGLALVVAAPLAAQNRAPIAVPAAPIAVPAAPIAVPAVPEPLPASPAAGPEANLTVPALTLVTLQVDTTISSKTAKRGDRFGITMLNEISVDGVVVIPRGSRGEGEVIHAAGVGFGGRAGELIVAARFLTIGAEKLPLQSFKLGNAGVSNTSAAIILAAGAGLVGAMASLFVTGTSAHIDAGQIAIAKTSAAFSIPRPAGEQVSTNGSTRE